MRRSGVETRETYSDLNSRERGERRERSSRDVIVSLLGDTGAAPLVKAIQPLRQLWVEQRTGEL